MLCLNTVFGDIPSSVYGIYVVLHVAYGRNYVEAIQDDGFLLLRVALGDAVFGGVGELTGRVTWGCYGVTAWITQANTSVG